MGELLSILAIIGLIALVAVSVVKQRAGARLERVDEDARTTGGDEQRQRSLRRRAAAKAGVHPDRD